MSYFYSEVVGIESLVASLDELGLADEHKKHLAQLVDSQIHHTVLDIILSKLSAEDKQLFLDQLAKRPHDKELMKFVTSRVEGIEDEIKQAVRELKKELHADIEEARKK